MNSLSKKWATRKSLAVIKSFHKTGQVPEGFEIERDNGVFRLTHKASGMKYSAQLVGANLIQPFSLEPIVQAVPLESSLNY